MLCPPLTSSATNGNCTRPSIPPAQRRATSACASIWCTFTSGTLALAATAVAFSIPTRRQMPSPGPCVTATAERSPTQTPAADSVSETRASTASRCAAAASWGTTPPCGPWMAAWLRTRWARMVPVGVSRAQPVSSQEDSRPRTSESGERAAREAWARRARGGRPGRAGRRRARRRGRERGSKRSMREAVGGARGREGAWTGSRV